MHDRSTADQELIEENALLKRRIQDLERSEAGTGQTGTAPRDSDDRLRTFYDLGLVGLTVTSTDKGWVLINDRLCQMLEYGRDELRTMTWAQLTHPDDLPADVAQFQRLLDGDTEGYELEKRFVTRSGRVVSASLVVRCVRKPDRSVDYCVAMVEDITERKRAEAHLRTLAAMLDTAPNSITVHDTQGRFLYANRRTFEIHGYDEQEFMALTVHDVDVPESAVLIEERLRVIAEKGEATFEVAHGRKNGTTVPLEVFVKQVEWAGDPALLSVATDITERKRAEEEKARLEGRLAQAQKMESVGRLAGGVAHDFNNMLGVILGYAELALDRLDPTQPLHADLTEIRKAASRSADLTRQLLAFASRQTVAPRVLDLNETVAGMVTMLRRLIGEAVELTWRPGKNLWPIRVDPSQIDQMLANLCVNARDAIADVGQITIETENSTLDENYCAVHAGCVPGEYVRLAVGDDGCGMDKETREQIFEPFFTTKGLGKGAGLGLATVYGGVKQNDGFITVDSEPGQGTTFTIYLPRHQGQAEQAQTHGSAGPGVRGRETVLLVEDERSLLDLTTRMLERQGYTVVAAHTPGDAIRRAREHAGVIHLLVTDVVMPEMNGWDLASTLLAIHPQVKHLFMSGYTADVIARQGLLNDGVQFIQKPFSADDLAAKVRETLDRD